VNGEPVPDLRAARQRHNRGILGIKALKTGHESRRAMVWCFHRRDPKKLCSKVFSGFLLGNNLKDDKIVLIKRGL